MTIAEKREIVNTIINLLLQLTAEEEVQEQPATSSKPVKATVAVLGTGNTVYF